MLPYRPLTLLEKERLWGSSSKRWVPKIIGIMATLLGLQENQPATPVSWVTENISSVVLYVSTLLGTSQSYLCVSSCLAPTYRLYRLPAPYGVAMFHSPCDSWVLNLVTNFEVGTQLFRSLSCQLITWLNVEWTNRTALIQLFVEYLFWTR